MERSDVKRVALDIAGASLTVSRYAHKREAAVFGLFDGMIVSGMTVGAIEPNIGLGILAFRRAFGYLPIAEEELKRRIEKKKEIKKDG